MDVGLRTRCAVVGMLALFSSTAALQDSARVLNEAARTLGVAELKSVRYSGTGFVFAFALSVSWITSATFA